MGWIEEKREYKEHFLNTELDLGYENIVKDYLTFMSKNFGYSRENFEKEYDEDVCMTKGENKHFDKYIYEDRIGFKTNIQNEYNKICSQSKERVKKFESQIIRLIKIIDKLENQNGNSYQKRKYRFILEFNIELLKKAEIRNNEIAWKEEAYSKAGIFASLSNWNLLELFQDMEFSAPEQDELYDWKHEINFDNLSTKESKRILDIKNTDKQAYIIEIEKYILEEQVCVSIVKTTRENFYLNKRLPVFEVATNCFNNKELLPFICIIVPQIEGMFADYMEIIGVKSSGNSITEKLERLNNKVSLWGYVYYAYDFPEIRNNVAHGYIIEQDLEEIACDILLDLKYLVSLIDSNDLEYKKVLEFLVCINESDEKKETSKKILEKYCRNLGENEELNFLIRVLEGEFDYILKWYNLSNALIKFRTWMKSEKFQNCIIDADIGKEEKQKLVKNLSSYAKFEKKWKDELLKIK